VNLIERESNIVTSRLFISIHNIDRFQPLAHMMRYTQRSISFNKFCHPLSILHLVSKNLFVGLHERRWFSLSNAGLKLNDNLRCYAAHEIEICEHKTEILHI
jgi:hypothetical protein